MTGPITQDTEVAVGTANPSPDHVKDPELPLLSEVTLQRTCIVTMQQKEDLYKVTEYHDLFDDDDDDEKI